MTPKELAEEFRKKAKEIREAFKYDWRPVSPAADAWEEAAHMVEENLL